LDVSQASGNFFVEIAVLKICMTGVKIKGRKILMNFNEMPSRSTAFDLIMKRKRSVFNLCDGWRSRAR
jgi:hypothetical protein